MNDESPAPESGADAAETAGAAEPADAAEHADAAGPADAAEPSPRELGPLLDPEHGDELEAHDRRHSGPGGEPVCPRCGTSMIRCVERHPAPRSDPSPFRVRLVCGSPDCRAWTIYNW